MVKMASFLSNNHSPLLSLILLGWQCDHMKEYSFGPPLQLWVANEV
jgi:hypothetical protein